MSRYELPPMIVNQFLLESGLNVVSPWYLVTHCPPCSPFHTVVGWCVCTLFICKGFPYRLLEKAWEGAWEQKLRRVIQFSLTQET